MGTIYVDVKVHGIAETVGELKTRLSTFSDDMQLVKPLIVDSWIRDDGVADLNIEEQ